MLAPCSWFFAAAARRWTPRHALVFAGVLAAGCGDGLSSPPAAPAGDEPPPVVRHLGQVSGSARPASGMVHAIVVLDPHVEIDVPLSAESPVMDQIGRQFVPGFILVRAGQTVSFTNSEDDLHTVHVKDSRGESLFNVATMMGSTYEHTFELGDEYSVICNTHTEMFADILVVDTPYAVIAEADGAFAIPDVVPGGYTATVIHGDDRTWHEVEVVAGANRIDLTEE